MSDPNEIRSEIVPLTEQAKLLTVQTDGDLLAAGALRATIKGCLKRIDEVCDPVVKAAHAAHKAAVKQKSDLQAPLVTADSTLGQRMAAYHEAQEAVRRQEEARLQAEETKRIEDARMADAELAEAVGDTQAATAILEAPVVAAPVRLEATKVEGTSFRKSWEFEIMDPNLIPREYLVVDEKKLRRVVQAMGETAKIPGVRIYSRTITSTRSA